MQPYCSCNTHGLGGKTGGAEAAAEGALAEDSRSIVFGLQLAGNAPARADLPQLRLELPHHGPPHLVPLTPADNWMSTWKQVVGREVQQACLMSTVKFAEPGMTLLEPGQTDIAPEVHTRLSTSSCCSLSLSGTWFCFWPPPPQRFSSQCITSAAAASGSLRSPIGTVPAWPCRLGCISVQVLQRMGYKCKTAKTEECRIVGLQ